MLFNLQKPLLLVYYIPSDFRQNFEKKYFAKNRLWFFPISEIKIMMIDNFQATK